MADKYSKEEKQILGQLFRLYRKYYKKPIKEYSEVIPSVTYYRVEKGEAKDEFFYKTAEKLGSDRFCYFRLHFPCDWIFDSIKNHQNRQLVFHAHFAHRRRL